MSIIRKIRSEIQKRVDRRIGTYLRSRYQSFKVTCPYVIEVNERQSLKGKVAVVTGGSGAIGRVFVWQQKVLQSMYVVHG